MPVTRMLEYALMISNQKDNYAKINTFKNSVFNKMRYDNPPDPYQTIEINPQSVEFILPNREFRLLNGLAQVRTGGWDRNDVAPIEKHWVVKGLTQRFEEGREWEETVYYSKLQEKEEGKKIEDICTYRDKLYEEISENGYVHGDYNSENKPDRAKRFRDYLEPLVAISRDGDIILYDGKHRFTIARLLGIDIPVHVIARHKKWQLRRDTFYKKRNSNGEGCDAEVANLFNHPDL